MLAISKVDGIYTHVNNWGSKRNHLVWMALYACWIIGSMVFSSWLFPSHASVAAYAACAGCVGIAVCSILFSVFFGYRGVSLDAVFTRVTSVILILAVPMVIIGAVACVIWGSDLWIVALTLPAGVGAIVGTPLFIVMGSAQSTYITPKF